MDEETYKQIFKKRCNNNDTFEWYLKHAVKQTNLLTLYNTLVATGQVLLDDFFSPSDKACADIVVL